MAVWRRSKSRTAALVRRSMTFIWLANSVLIPVGVLAAYRLPAWQVPWPKVFVEVGTCLFFVGLGLRWFFAISGFFRANATATMVSPALRAGPDRVIRHRHYAAHLLTILGFVLTFQNWASLLILFLPGCAMTLWRLRIDEQALAGETDS